MDMTPKKRSVRVGRIQTVQDVVREGVKLYKRSVHGKVDSNDAARQSSILANIRAAMEQGVIEARLAAMEEAVIRLAANKKPIMLEAKEDVVSQSQKTRKA
jgi:hypothetical protein